MDYLLTFNMVLNVPSASDGEFHPYRTLLPSVLNDVVSIVSTPDLTWHGIRSYLFQDLSISYGAYSCISALFNSYR